MLKGMWRTGDLDFIPYAPLRDTFFEWYWNPGDWSPAKKQFLPRPWSAPIVNPLKDPRTPPTGGRGLFNILSNLTPFDVDRLYRNTKLFARGTTAARPATTARWGCASAPLPHRLPGNPEASISRSTISTDGGTAATTARTPPRSKGSSTQAGAGRPEAWRGAG